MIALAFTPVNNLLAESESYGYHYLMSVGRKLKKWRRENKLSERAAAKLVGVSQPTWREVEADDYGNIGLDVARRFVETCGVDFADFRGAS